MKSSPLPNDFLRFFEFGWCTRNTESAIEIWTVQICSSGFWWRGALVYKIRQRSSDKARWRWPKIASLLASTAQDFASSGSPSLTETIKVVVPAILRQMLIDENGWVKHDPLCVVFVVQGEFVVDDVLSKFDDVKREIHVKKQLRKKSLDEESTKRGIHIQLSNTISCIAKECVSDGFGSAYWIADAAAAEMRYIKWKTAFEDSTRCIQNSEWLSPGRPIMKSMVQPTRIYCERDTPPSTLLYSVLFWEKTLRSTLIICHPNPRGTYCLFCACEYPRRWIFIEFYRTRYNGLIQESFSEN